jgi:hypothetical protein
MIIVRYRLTQDTCVFRARREPRVPGFNARSCTEQRAEAFTAFIPSDVAHNLGGQDAAIPRARVSDKFGHDVCVILRDYDKALVRRFFL